MKTTQTKPVHHLAKYQLFKRLLKLGTSDIVAIANEVGITETQANKWLSPPAKQKAKKATAKRTEYKELDLSYLFEFAIKNGIRPSDSYQLAELMAKYVVILLAYPRKLYINKLSEYIDRSKLTAKKALFHENKKGGAI